MTKSKKRRLHETMATAGMSPIDVENAGSKVARSNTSTALTRNHSTPIPHINISPMSRSEDSSTWSKSKKKRMRRKEAKRLLMTAEGKGGDVRGNSIKHETNSPISPKKQSPSDNATHQRNNESTNSTIKSFKSMDIADNVSHSKNNKPTNPLITSPSAPFSNDNNKSFGDGNRGSSTERKDANISPKIPISTQYDDNTVLKSTLQQSGQPSAAATPAENSGALSERSQTKEKKKKKKKKKKAKETGGDPNANSRPKVDDSKLLNHHHDNKKQDKNGNDQSTATTTTNNGGGGGGSSSNTTPTCPKLQISLPKPSQMSTLQKAFLERLTSSRFRELNEELYTQSSQQSYEQFTKHPELFDQYHVGFRKQVQEWPLNPVDVIYKKITSGWKKAGISSMGENGERELHYKYEGEQGREKVVIADFGCGDAKLAERLLALRIGKDGRSLVQASGKKLSNGNESSSCPFRVYSFDLVSGGNPLVTPADMSNVPLSNEAVDVAVYSLALMGTNVADFVREAWRVLKFKGVLRVAEVRSRFETAASGGDEDESRGSGMSGDGGGIKRGKLNNGKKYLVKNGHQSQRKNTADSENSAPKTLMLLDEFMSLMERCGFRCTNLDQSNKMFLFMDFVKVDGSKGLSDKETFTAKPCIYKRR